MLLWHDKCFMEIEEHFIPIYDNINVQAGLNLARIRRIISIGAKSGLAVAPRKSDLI